MASPAAVNFPALALDLGATTGTAYDGALGASAATAADAAQVTANSALVAVQTVKPYTVATRTLIVGDVNVLATDTNATAVTVTLPKDSAVTIPIGSSGDVVQLGEGKVTFAVDDTSAIQPSTTLSISARYGRVKWEKIAANTYLLSGSLSA